MKIRKGDKVVILAGKDRNKTGIVEKVLVKTNEVIIAGANTVKKHVKISKKFPSGGVIEIEKPLTVSNIQLVCPNCGKKTRIAYEIKGNEKTRICKKCGKQAVAQKTKESK